MPPGTHRKRGRFSTQMVLSGRRSGATAPMSMVFTDLRLSSAIPSAEIVHYRK